MSDDLSDNSDPRPDAAPLTRALGVNGVPDGYILLQDAPDYETGEIILSTLASEGIYAVMKKPLLSPPSNIWPVSNTWSHAVYVAERDIEAAQAIMSATAPSEEELAAEQAADPTTLEEAERNVRDA